MRNPGLRRGAEKDETLFPEWMDSFYGRDIQELFAVRERLTLAQEMFG